LDSYVYRLEQDGEWAIPASNKCRDRLLSYCCAQCGSLINWLAIHEDGIDLEWDNHPYYVLPVTRHDVPVSIVHKSLYYLLRDYIDSTWVVPVTLNGQSLGVYHGIAFSRSCWVRLKSDDRTKLENCPKCGRQNLNGTISDINQCWIPNAEIDDRSLFTYLGGRSLTLTPAVFNKIINKNIESIVSKLIAIR